MEVMKLSEEDYSFILSLFKIKKFLSFFIKKTQTKPNSNNTIATELCVSVYKTSQKTN